jgi:hypothetical protein
VKFFVDAFGRLDEINSGQKLVELGSTHIDQIFCFVLVHFVGPKFQNGDWSLPGLPTEGECKSPRKIECRRLGCEWDQTPLRMCGRSESNLEHCGNEVQPK